MNWTIKTKLKETDHDKRRQEILKALLHSRGLQTKAQIKDFFDPHSPMDLSPKDFGLDQSNLDSAVKLINQHITDGNEVVIYGDYDADGITATAVMWLALNKVGAKAFPFIPDRKDHGYGISQAGLDEISKNHSPKLVITVDNGIVANQPIQDLINKDINVILTDHHQPSGELPKANAIIHSDQIAGSGVAWVLARELLKATDPDFANSLLDLVSIGTIADLMPMVGINRSFAKHGLKALTQTTKPGLKALKKIADIQSDTVMSAYHVGYILGPRINAMGRIGDGTQALRLLCTQNVSAANQLADLLNKTNKQRQELTYDLTTLADQIYKQTDTTQKIIVISSTEFHEGVIGLIAGRLAEKYHKPAIAISIEDQGCKGSARSVSGINVIELIRLHKDLLTGCGGHPGAAGLSIQEDQIEEFTKQIQFSAQNLDQTLFEKTIEAECELELSDIDFQLHQEIEKLIPFGIGNKKPIFYLETNLEFERFLGKDNKHVKFKTPDNPKLEAIYFNIPETLEPQAINNKQKIIAKIGVNEWNGNTKLQLIVSTLDNPSPTT